MKRAFNELKAELVKEIVLAYPDYSERSAPIEVFVDVSAFGAGGCLMQWQDNDYKIIANASFFCQLRSNTQR